MALKKLEKTILSLQVTTSLGQISKFTHEGPEIIVGRGSECQIRVNDVGISRKHLMIQIKNDQVFLTDLDSSNGTFINEEKINPNEPVLYDTFFLPLRLGPKLQLLITPEGQIG